MFYRNLDQPELDEIQTIKELLCVKYGLLSLPSLDVSQIDFIARVTVYFLTFTYFLCVLLYDFIYLTLVTLRKIYYMHVYISMRKLRTERIIRVLTATISCMTDAMMQLSN